jgi:hypothetical protein
MLNGIIQWLRLRLDPNAKQRTIEEARQVGREISSAMGKAGRESGDQMERGIEDGLRDAERTAEGTARKVRGSFMGAFSGLGGMLAGIFALDKIRDFVRHMWELGSAAGETQSKFNTVFGQEGSAQVQAFIDQFGTLMGLNNTMAQEMTATAGAIVQGMGASREASALFAQQMVTLAGDLQSFHNVPIQDTFRAIRSGMTGEYEALKSLGIVIRQADIDTLALANSNKTAAKELTQTERATAALQLITERAGVAVGDLGRTKDSTANRARNLYAEYENLKIELAKNLLPVFATFIDWLDRNKIELHAAAVAAAFTAKVLVGVLGAALNSVASIIAGTFATAWGSVQILLGTTLTIINGVVEGFVRLGNVVGLASDAAVAAARARTASSTNMIRQGARQWQAGVNETWQGINGQRAAEGYFGTTGAFGLSQGNFEWQPPRERPQDRPQHDPDAAGKAERDRIAQMTAEVNLVREMSERRAQFPELIERATAAEARLRAELESGTATTARRVTLLDQIEKVQEVIQGRDPASIRAARDLERAEEERRRGIVNELSLLEDAAENRKVAAEMGQSIADRAKALEAQLRAELDQGNVTLERRLEILEQIGQAQGVQNTASPARQRERDEKEKLDFQDQWMTENTEALLEEWSAVGNALMEIADGWADAWEDAFSMIISESGSASDAINAFAKTMGASILGALANFARGKMRENVAAALEEVANAVGAAAWGNAPKAAAHLKSAAGHGAAAAAWGILAGASGAGASAVAGGGGGGGAGGSSIAGGSGRVGGKTADSRDAETHVYLRVVNRLDPFDPTRPAVQEFVVAAQRNAAIRGLGDDD